MRYQQDLQVALRDRLRRLMTTGSRTYGYEVGLIREWMRGQAAVRALLDEFATVEPEVDVTEWVQACNSSRGLHWPTSTEAGRARLIWEWLQTVEDDDRAVMGLGPAISAERNLDAIARDLTEAVVTPLFDYLGERLGAESSALYLLERYIRRVEWFERDALYTRYIGNTQQGEALYDTDLRRFLFDQGLNMPFSQPKSASGLSDALADMDTDDPLVCEVKIFDADGHDKRGIVTGMQQVVNYAQDYGKSTAYLVIINLSGRALELPSDGRTKTWPSYVEVAGVRVHLINVRALPTASASKMGKARPVVLAREDLVEPDVT